jgi:glycosyltransferase involved in cell wall biosynthesis
VNPPIDVPSEEPALDLKRPVILSVGRFFAAGHSKRHDVMVRAFKHLCEEGLHGWELHLAGSVQRANPADVRYLAEVQESARGYPVQFHVDAPLETLKLLYSQASIYWHAAGYGSDFGRRPADLEHFGMTTAEAMGYGAVPVAIAFGGQPEVVDDGSDGFLWGEPEALQARTLELVQDDDLRRRMGTAARRASLRFSRAEFQSRMVEAISPIVAQLAVERRSEARTPPQG